MKQPNTMVLLTRIAEKQDRAAQLHEELVLSLAIQQYMPELFARGKFSLHVTGRYLTRSVLPYKAYIKYEKCGAVMHLTYQQWSVLTRTYYSPDEHKTIERYWNSDGT